MNYSTTKPPTWFWIVSVVALLWNLSGVAMYLVQAYMTDETLATLPADQQAMYANLPSWYIASFALAVFCGALGCIALLLRKKWANPFLLISLIAALVQMSYLTFSLKMANIMTPIVIIIGIALVWFARKAQKEGWIG